MSFEDAGGFFCSVCGNSGPHKCDILLDEGDIDWPVIYETMKDTLEQEDAQGEQSCHYNYETRKRAMEKLKKWRKQTPRRNRLLSYHQGGK